MTVAPTQDRRSDLDWLRVLAFGLLIFYHGGMAFSGWDWHVTDGDSLPWLREIMRFMNRWRMPLLFAISGATIMLALGRRSPLAFLRDRSLRLGVPLIFGMLIVVPPQVWAERVHRGQFDGSYMAWLPQAFDGIYPAGNASWHHLWFLAYVLVLTVLLLPLFLWARGRSGARTVERAAGFVARYRLHWLAPLPLFASLLWLAPISRNPNGLFGDWHGLAGAAILLLYGAVIWRSGALLDVLERQRWLALAIGVAGFAALEALYFAGTVRPRIPADERPLFALLSAVNTMAWIFAIAGFARRHLQARPAWLRRATEAVYPFYILHQTVAVLTVAVLVRTALPLELKFALTVAATFGGTWLLYEALRRFNVSRVLLGLKPFVAARPLASGTAADPAAAASGHAES